MTRSEVRDFLEAGVNALDPPPTFGYGLYSFFNSNRSWEYPLVFQETAPVNSEVPTQSAPVDEWEIILHVANLTKLDAVPSEYEPLIDDCDLIAQKLIYQYRAQVSGYKLVRIEGFSREPFTKINADLLAGVTLRFNLKVTNQTNVC